METQLEKNLVINGRELKYKGIFRFDELVSTINRALEERGYEKREKKTEELVKEGGRKTLVELRPFKIKTNYCKLLLNIKINLDNVRETVELFQGEKKKFQQGELNITFDAWSLTDYKMRWGMTPFVYFWKGIINKYVYTWPQEAGFINELYGDTAYIYVQIKKLLRTYQPGEMLGRKEEEVLKEMGEEVRKAEKED